MITLEQIGGMVTTALDVSTLFKQERLGTLYKLIQYDPCSTYFVTIDYNGHDGENVIKNIQINKEIKVGNN